jgi:hypothetical protein
MPEETEQLDELKTSTLARYIGKSQQSARDSAYQAGEAARGGSFARADNLQKQERKRAAGIMRATHKLARRAVGEEVEQIDEISTRTLARAAHRASDPEADMMYDKPHDPQKFAAHAAKRKDAKSAAAVQGAADAKGHFPRPHHTMGYDDMEDRQNRSTQPSMVTKAGKLTKTAQKGLKSQLRGEEVEQIDERSLTEPEMEKKEKYVMGMKKKLSGFKERYGDRAKSVMYATAAKMAKED